MSESIEHVRWAWAIGHCLRRRSLHRVHADFAEFLHVIISQNKKEAARGDESDTVDAFIALGGNPDKTGEISAEKLRGVVKDFGLTIDIEVRRSRPSPPRWQPRPALTRPPLGSTSLSVASPSSLSLLPVRRSSSGKRTPTTLGS